MAAHRMNGEPGVSAGRGSCARNPSPAEATGDLFEGRDGKGAVHVAKVVRRRLRSNGDWNINDWKDVADALSAFILRAVGENPHA